MKVFLDGISITFCETMRYFVDINLWQAAQCSISIPNENVENQMSNVFREYRK